jgi:hypothetical protein
MIVLLAHSNEFEVSTKNSFSCANIKQSFCAFNTKITIWLKLTIRWLLFYYHYSLGILWYNCFAKYVKKYGKKSMEILFNVQPTLPSKNKIVPDLSVHWLCRKIAYTSKIKQSSFRVFCAL